MDTNWVNHIDWEKDETYDDLGLLFGALAQAFLGADVTSRTDDIVDGSIKQYVLARMVEMSYMMKNHDKWIHVRPIQNYTPHEGHHKG